MEEDFGKEYRLHLKDEIETLFREGRKIHVFPLLSHLCIIDGGAAPRFSVLISVPKKKIKKAHDRNRIKRMIRECLRRNKEPLVNKTIELGCVLHFSIVYLSSDIMDYPKLEFQIKQIIQKICA